MKNWLGILGTGLGIAGSLFAMSGWCLVEPGEVVVVRRFGRIVDPPWGPGLHWHIPLGIDRLDRVRSDAVRQFTVGQAGPPRVDQDPSEGEVLTGDLNLMRIQATLQYRVARPVDYVVRAEHVEPLLVRTTEGSLSRAMARRGIDSVLRSDRRRIADEVEAEVQTTSDRLSLGVTILGVSLTDARPPLEVAADFAAAQSAESQRDGRINEARTYEAVQLTRAAARGQAVQEAARPAAERTVLHAQAEARRFLALLVEVNRSRGLTMKRLYIESLQSLLEGVKRKLILPAGDAPDLTVIGLDGKAPTHNLTAPASSERPQLRQGQNDP
jgi:modulator of FtsH protease HflK